MSKPLSTVASVGITFLVTLLLNTAMNYYSSDKGTVGISRSIPIGGKLVTVVTIENYTKEFLDGVALEVPVAVSLASLFSDAPVKLSEESQTHAGSTRLVRVDQINPRLVTRIFVPVPAGVEGSQIRIANAEASGVSLRRDDELQSPLRKALLDALVVAAIYALLALAAVYYMKRENKALEKRVDALSTQAEGWRSEIKGIETRVTKQRLLLQARLFDYAKELEYWRTTIRTLLLKAGAEKSSVDTLISDVTKSLGTHGTREPAEGFEAIRVAAGWLAEAERK